MMYESYIYNAVVFLKYQTERLDSRNLWRFVVASSMQFHLLNFFFQINK